MRTWLNWRFWCSLDHCWPCRKSACNTHRWSERGRVSCHFLCRANYDNQHVACTMQLAFKVLNGFVGLESATVMSWSAIYNREYNDRGSLRLWWTDSRLLAPAETVLQLPQHSRRCSGYACSACRWSWPRPCRSDERPHIVVSDDGESKDGKTNVLTAFDRFSPSTKITIIWRASMFYSRCLNSVDHFHWMM